MSREPSSSAREAANRAALERLTGADPVIVDIQPASEVVPGMKPNLVLTSGPPLPWSEYRDAQRIAILAGAVYEGLAKTSEEAAARFDAGEIEVGSTHEHGCAAPHAGLVTSSMSMFVVEDRASGAIGRTPLFEGGPQTPRRLYWGFYDEEIARQFRLVEEVVAPTLRDAIRATGGLEMRPLLRDALLFGDDGHVRATASTVLFAHALMPALVDLARERHDEVTQTVEYLQTASFAFGRPWMAANKAVMTAITGIEGSSLVTAMTLNFKETAISVSGLPGQWFRGPPASFEGLIKGRFIRRDEPNPEGWGCPFGADSPISECAGFGGFCTAAALPLEDYFMGGVSSQDLIDRNRAVYDIVVGEHPEYKIPALDHRGVPLGIDLFKVLEKKQTPMINAGSFKHTGDNLELAGGAIWFPMECFEAAAEAYRARYEK